MKKRILMILTRNPYPTDNGRKTILAQTIDFLKDEYEISILFLSKDDINYKFFKNKGVAQVYPLSFPNTFQMIKNILFMRNHSLQERLFYSNENQEKIYNVVDHFNPDIIYVDMIRMSPYAENLDIFKIIDIDDLLSIRYQRFLSIRESSILGTYSFILPSFFRYIIEYFFKKTVLTYEIKKIEKREINVTKKYNLCFLVSKKEKNYLIKKTGITTIYTNTQAIKLKKYIFSSPDKNTMIFLGNMLTAQNLASMHLIINKILKNLDIDYELIIVGKYDSRLENMIGNNNKIKIFGYVEDLETLLRRVKLAIIPIAFGTGIKTKILDCMSYGIPVFTNVTGSEGLPIKNKVHAIIEDNPNKMAEGIEEMLNNKILLNKISKQGYEYVRNHHSFDTLKKKFLSNIEHVFV